MNRKITLQLTKTRLLDWQDDIIIKMRKIWHEKKLECEIFFLSSSLLLFLARLPYFNVLLGNQATYFLIILLWIFLFKISEKKLLVFILGLYLLAIFITLLGKPLIAEYIGNQIYFILWIIFFKSFKKLWNQI